MLRLLAVIIEQPSAELFFNPNFSVNPELTWYHASC